MIRGLANSGCYFLCLCQIAELEGANVDVVKSATDCMKKGWMTSDCFIKDASKVMNHLLEPTKKKASISWGDKPRGDAYNVREWYNQNTGLTHFTLRDWDSMTNSLTKKNGKVRSYRIVDIIK